MATDNGTTGAALTVTADEGTTFSTIDLNGGTTDGALSITVDADNDTAETLTINGGISNVASVALSAGALQDTSHDDLIDINADITTTAGAITIQNTNEADLAQAIDLIAVGPCVSVGSHARDNG